jgi:predicted MFS family arabinose efflux permease
MYQQKNYNSFVPWLMILLAGSFYCYEYILRISPSVMIPELMSSFSIQATQIGLLSSFYYFGYSMGSVLVGPFVDKYGPKKVLFWAAILCALGTLLFAHADSLALAKLSRLIIGLGSAFAFIGVLKIGAIWLPGDYFGRLAGMCSM